MPVWQLTVPSQRRRIAELMLQFSIALLGPGETSEATPDRLSEGIFPAHVRRFVREASAGDALVLRIGRERAIAVGEIAGPYEYLPQFEDVDGFDLRHTRRVRWYPFAVEQGREHGLLPAGNSPFVPVTSAALVALARSALDQAPRPARSSPLPALPPEQPIVEDSRPQIRQLIAEAEDLWQLYRVRQHFGEPPSESELVGHLVVRLARALGWRPEQIAVEWRRVDVALFRRLPRLPENLHLVMEAKKIGAASLDALKQAREYLNAIGAMTDVIVTDGFTYRRYKAAGGYSPDGYLNMCRLTADGARLLDEMSSDRVREEENR